MRVNIAGVVDVLDMVKTDFEKVDLCDLCYDDAKAVYEVCRCFHCYMGIGLAAKAQS